MQEGVIHWNGGRRWRLKKAKRRRWVGGKNRHFTLLGPNCKVLWSYRRYVGMCVLGLSRSSDGGRTFLPFRRYEEVSVKKRVPAAEKASTRHLAAMETDMLAQCQALVEHCALLQYDDGDVRKPGKVFIETVGFAWKVTVKDVDTCTQFSVVADRLDKALEGAALLLSAEDAPWEPDQWALDRKHSKKK